MADTERQTFTAKTCGALWPWILEKVFEHGMAIIAVSSGGVMTSIATISNKLKG